MLARHAGRVRMHRGKCMDMLAVRGTVALSLALLAPAAGAWELNCPELAPGTEYRWQGLERLITTSCGRRGCVADPPLLLDSCHIDFGAGDRARLSFTVASRPDRIPASRLERKEPDWIDGRRVQWSRDGVNDSRRPYDRTARLTLPESRQARPLYLELRIQAESAEELAEGRRIARQIRL